VVHLRGVVKNHIEGPKLEKNMYIIIYTNLFFINVGKICYFNGHLVFIFPAGPNDLRHFFFSVMWASMSIAIAAFMRANGRIFCNRPRLHKPR
jgi:hypothetical protein